MPERFEDEKETAKQQAIDENAREAVKQQAADENAMEAAKQQAADKNAREAAKQQAIDENARETAKQQAIDEDARETAERQAIDEEARKTARKKMIIWQLEEQRIAEEKKRAVRFREIMEECDYESDADAPTGSRRKASTPGHRVSAALTRDIDFMCTLNDPNQEKKIKNPEEVRRQLATRLMYNKIIASIINNPNSSPQAKAMAASMIDDLDSIHRLAEQVGSMDYLKNAAEALRQLSANAPEAHAALLESIFKNFRDSVNHAKKTPERNINNNGPVR